MSDVLLGLYVVVLMIRPMDWWEPTYGWQLVSIGAILLALVGAPTLMARFRVIWRQVPQLKIAGLFWLGLGLSFATKLNFMGLQEVFQDFGKVMFFFVLILVLVENLKGVNTLLLGLQIGILFLAIHAILQHNTGVGFGGKEPTPRVNIITGEITYQARAFGTFDDPNDLCLMLVVGIPMFYVLSKTGTNPFQKLIALGGSAVSAYGAWCTNSRGGVIAAFGMIGGFVLVRLRGVKRYVAGGIAFSIVTVLAPSRFGGGGMVGRDRSELWGDGLEMFKSNPLFGVGYEMFEENNGRHQVAHNSYVQTLAEGGLVTYLPFFLLLCLTMVQLRRLINEKNVISRTERQILSGIFAALIGDFTGMYFISRQYQHILYTLLGVAIVMTYLTSVKYNLQNQVFGPVKRDVRMGLLWGLGSIVVMWITIRIVNQLG